MSVGGYRWWPTPSLTEFMLCFLASSLIPSLLLLPLRVCFHINQKFQTQGIKHKTGDWLSNYAVGILYCFTELEFEIIHVTLQASGLATKQKKKVHVFTCPHGWVSSTMSNTRHASQENCSTNSDKQLCVGTRAILSVLSVLSPALFS